MIKELRRIEIGNYLLTLLHNDGQSEVFGTLPELWSVRTDHFHLAVRRPNRFIKTQQCRQIVARKRSFVSGATQFNRTVARIREAEAQRLLTTPMIPEVAC